MNWPQLSDSWSPQTHQTLLCWRTQTKASYSAQNHHEQSLPQLGLHVGATGLWWPGPGPFLQTDYIITVREI